MMDRITRTARKCLSMGLSVIPIGVDKFPAVRWKNYIDSPMSEWNFPGCNMAILTGAGNGIVVVDCDTRISSLRWLSSMPATPLMSKSARGVHFYYQHPGVYVKSDSHIKLGQNLYDVKADRSYVLAPPSERKGCEYSFVKHSGNPRGIWMCPSKLPVFNTAWRPERAKTGPGLEGEGVKNIASYIDKIQCGEGGRDRGTFRVCKIAMEVGLCESEAMAIVIDWHMRNCTPPWSVMEVAEKVKRTYRGG